MSCVHRNLIAAATALALFAGNAWAQTGAQTGTTAVPPATPAPPAAGSATAPQPPAATAAKPASPSKMSTATAALPAAGAPVVGLEVLDTGKEKVGKVSDVIVAPDGAVDKIILSVGGVLGVGGKYVEVNWKDLRIDEPKGVAYIDMSKDQLNAAPEYRYARSRNGG